MKQSLAGRQAKKNPNMLLNIECLVARIVQLARRYIERLRMTAEKAVEKALSRIKAGMSSRERSYLATLGIAPLAVEKLAAAGAGVSRRSPVKKTPGWH